MRLLSKLSILLLLAAASLPASPCRAEPTPSDADRAAAEALFEQGRALMEKGDYAPACEKLRASKELDPAVGTMLYLGDCYEKGNLLASAFMAFEEARAVADQRGDKRAEIAAVRSAALKPRLLYVVVELTGERPEGLQIRANGRVLPLDMLATPAPMDEGTLTVVATAPGYESSQVQIQLVAGAKEPYRALLPALRSMSATEAAPEPAAAPAPALAPKDAPAREDGSGQRTTAYIVGGVGAAALLAGGVFAVLANGNNSDSKEQCADDDPNACSVAGKGLRDDALNQAAIATVLGIAGGVVLAAGVTLYVTAPSDDDVGFGLSYGGTF